jgi:hypothetical protein
MGMVYSDIEDLLDRHLYFEIAKFAILVSFVGVDVAKQGCGSVAGSNFGM